MVAVIAAMFSMTALAATRWQASFTYNTQTKTSPAVAKNNYNNHASAVCKSTEPSNVQAVTHNGTIEAYSQLSGGGGESGTMLLESLSSTQTGRYGSYHYNFNYVLVAKLRGCDFTGTYMRQNIDWTP